MGNNYLERSGPDSDNCISLMAVGDIMLGRNVGSYVKEHSNQWLFENVRNTLNTSDILLGNLESPVLGVGTPILEKAVVPLFAQKSIAIPILKNINFSFLNLGNNHILDHGQKGLEDTLKSFKENNINYFGAGHNIAEAAKPACHIAKETHFSFLSYCPSYNATTTLGGTVPLNISNMINDVKREKKINNVVVVSIHAGVEYSDYPTPDFVSKAHRLVDAGADVILGHHPHVLQGVECYKGSIIAYSLGNFVFDTPDENIKNIALRQCLLAKKYGVLFPENDNRPNESVILEIKFSCNKIIEYILHPVIIGIDFRPSLLEGYSADKLLARISAISENIYNKRTNIHKTLRKIDNQNARDYILGLGWRKIISLLWRKSYLVFK